MTDLTTSPAAPAARKDHKEINLHGVTLTDDYAWLRDKENPEVTEYLKAENAYAEALTADLAPLRDQLYNEARHLGIDGRSRMNKAQLQRAVDSHK